MFCSVSIVVWLRVAPLQSTTRQPFLIGVCCLVQPDCTQVSSTKAAHAYVGVTFLINICLCLLFLFVFLFLFFSRLFIILFDHSAGRGVRLLLLLLLCSLIIITSSKLSFHVFIFFYCCSSITSVFLFFFFLFPLSPLSMAHSVLLHFT